jgi:hypothetical protein
MRRRPRLRAPEQRKRKPSSGSAKSDTIDRVGQMPIRGFRPCAVGFRMQLAELALRPGERGKPLGGPPLPSRQPHRPGREVPPPVPQSLEPRLTLRSDILEMAATAAPTANLSPTRGDSIAVAPCWPNREGEIRRGSRRLGLAVSLSNKRAGGPATAAFPKGGGAWAPRRRRPFPLVSADHGRRRSGRYLAQAQERDHGADHE